MAYRINWSAFSVPEFNEAQDAVRTLDLDILTEGICEAGYWAEAWIRRMALSIFRGDVPASVIGRVEAVSPSAAEHLRFASVSSEFGALDFTSHRAVANIDRVDTSQFSAYSLDALNRLTQALGAGPVSSAVDALNVMAPIGQAIALRYAETVLGMIGAPEAAVDGVTATGSIQIDMDSSSTFRADDFPDHDLTAWNVISRRSEGRTMFLTAQSRYSSDADSIISALHRQIGELSATSNDRAGSPMTIRGSISLTDTDSGQEIQRYGSPVREA